MAFAYNKIGHLREFSGLQSVNFLRKFVRGVTAYFEINFEALDSFGFLYVYFESLYKILYARDLVNESSASFQHVDVIQAFNDIFNDLYDHRKTFHKNKYVHFQVHVRRIEINFLNVYTTYIQNDMKMSFRSV